MTVTVGPAPAVTGPELAALAKASVPRWYAVFNNASNAPVGTAMTTGTITFPLKTIPITGQSVNWGNIKPGDTVLIGTTPGGFDVGIFRTRWDNFLTFPNLEINEVMQNDSGELNEALRNYTIAPGQYVTVLHRFDLFGKQPKIDYSGVGTTATIYEDTDRGIFSENRWLAPIVEVWMDGRDSDLGRHVYADTSYTFDIVLQVFTWFGNNYIYSINLPTGFVLNSGTLTDTVGNGTQITVNVTVPHSADVYEIEFVCTDTGGIGTQFKAYRNVWIKSNTYPPISIVSIDSDVDDWTGTKTTITFNKLTGFPPGAKWHLFDMGTWGAVDVPTARKSITGWASARREITGIGVTNVQLDIEGPAYVLGRIGGRSQLMSAVTTTPATYQELWYQLCRADIVMFWLMWERVSGLLEQFNICFNPVTGDGSGNTAYCSEWRIDTGTILQQLQSLAGRWRGGNFGTNPTGTIMMRSHVSRVPWASRGSIPIRCTFTASKMSGTTLGYAQRPSVRYLRTEAFVSDAVSVNTPYWSDAIGSQGEREEKLERMLVQSTAEEDELCGNQFQWLNNPYPQGTLNVPKNWAVIYPAEMSRIGLDIAPSLRYDGQEYNGYVIARSVSYNHTPEGVDVVISIEAETVGTPATQIPIPLSDPTTGSSPYQFQKFAPVPLWRKPNPNPMGTKAGPRVIPKDGSVGFGGTSSKAYLVSNVLGTPKLRDITPTALMPAGWSIRHGYLKRGDKKAYLLLSNVTNGKVVHTNDLFVNPQPVWVDGNSFGGVYTEIRQGDSAGQVGAYGPQNITFAPDACMLGPSWQADSMITYDFVADGQVGWQNAGFHGETVWEAGLGWTWFPAPGAPQEIRIFLDMGSYVDLRWIQVYFTRIYGTPTHQMDAVTHTQTAHGMIASGGDTSVVCVPFTLPNDTPEGPICVPTDPNGHCVWPSDQLLVRLNSFNDHEVYLTKINLGFIGTVPVTPHRTTTVRVSSDDGVNFGAAQNVVVDGLGDVNGYDTVRGTNLSYAAGALAIKKATTWGGAFSLDQTLTQNPMCIETPWSQRFSLALDNTDQYIFGLGAPDGSGHTWFWVVSGTPQNITPVIGGQPGLAVGPDCVTTYLGKYIAMLASFGGTTHLVTSIDGGITWTDRGAVPDKYIRVRRLQSAPNQFYICGGSVFDYTNTWGSKLVSKSPLASLTFFEAYN